MLEFIKRLQIFNVLYGAKAKKLTGLCDATHTITENLQFQAPNIIEFPTEVPSFLQKSGKKFKISSGGGANEGLVLTVAQISGLLLYVEESSIVANSSLATLDARQAIIEDDTTIAKISSTTGNTIYNVNKHSGSECPAEAVAEHFHTIDDIPGLCTPYEFTFVSGDFFSSDAGDTYSIDVAHGLNTLYPKVKVFENDIEVLPHAIRIIDSNTVRIKVAQAGIDCRFSGKGVIDC